MTARTPRPQPIEEIDLTIFDPPAPAPRRSAATPAPAALPPVEPVTAADFSITADDAGKKILAVTKSASESARAFSLRAGASATEAARRLLSTLGVTGDLSLEVSRLQRGDALDITALARDLNRVAALTACVENLVLVHEVLHEAVLRTRPDFISRGDAEAGILDFRALLHAVVSQSMAFDALESQEKRLRAEVRAAEERAESERRRAAELSAQVARLREDLAAEKKAVQEARQEAQQAAARRMPPAPPVPGVPTARAVNRAPNPPAPPAAVLASARAENRTPHTPPPGALAALVTSVTQPAQPPRPPVSAEVSIYEDDDEADDVFVNPPPPVSTATPSRVSAPPPRSLAGRAPVRAPSVAALAPVRRRATAPAASK